MTAILSILRYWKELLAGAAMLGLSLMLVIRTHQRDALSTQLQSTRAAFNETVQNYKLATAKAQADDLAHARDVEARGAAIALEKQNALETQLATARGNLAAYVRLHAAPGADQGSGGVTDVPNAAGAPSGASVASTDAVVPVADLDLCARATVMAQGWQAWWSEVSAQPR